MRLTLGVTLKFCSSVEKELKLKVKRSPGLIPMFGEITEKKLIGGGGLFVPRHSE